MKEIIAEYSDRIRTPIFIGMRSEYMKNEDEIRKLDNDYVADRQIILTTPRNAMEMMIGELKKDSSPNTT